MALTFAEALIKPCDAQTINAAATFTSAQVTRGANTVAVQAQLFLEADWTIGGAPGGNERVIVTIVPRHTTGGNNYPDQAVSYTFQADLGQLYRWSIPLPFPPLFYVVTILNDTGVNTDPNTVHCWIATTDVTH